MLACSGPKPQIPEKSQSGSPDASLVKVNGDLDEGIKALLVFRGEGDVERQGAGWARVKAFREGVIKGAQACLNYQA
jgi:hypothetical protein